MVYHNLSMSLNHHVPILNCTVTTRGSSFSRSDTWLTFKLFKRRFAGISPSHTHTHTDWLTPTSKSQAPPLRVTLPVFFGVMWPGFISTVGTLVLNLHIRCPFVYTTDVLHRSKRLWGEKRERSLCCDRFQAFSNGRNTSPGLLVRLFSLLFVFHRRSDASLCSFMCSEINHEYKDLLIFWLGRRASCIALCLNLWVQKDLCMPPLLNWRNAMYVFWLERKAKRQGKPFQSGGQ